MDLGGRPTLPLLGEAFGALVAALAAAVEELPADVFAAWARGGGGLATPNLASASYPATCGMIFFFLGAGPEAAGAAELAAAEGAEEAAADLTAVANARGRLVAGSASASASAAACACCNEGAGCCKPAPGNDFQRRGDICGDASPPDALAGDPVLGPEAVEATLGGDAAGPKAVEDATFLAAASQIAMCETKASTTGNSELSIGV